MKRILAAGLWLVVLCMPRDAAAQAPLKRELTPEGVTAYFELDGVFPVGGKLAMRKRIQNFVVLTLPSVYRDDELEIYRLEPGSSFEDRTQEIEDRL